MPSVAAMTSASTAATASTAARTAASSATTTTTAATTAAARTAIAAVGPISSAASAYRSFAIKVWLSLFLFVEVGAAFNGHRSSLRRSCYRNSVAIGWLWTAAHLRTLLFQNRLARQPNPVALYRQHLYQDLIAFLQFIANVTDAVFSHFADVQQAIGSGEDLDERAKVG